MAIESVRRLTFVVQVSRNAANKGKGLALEVRGLKGLESRAVDVLKNLPAILAMKRVEVKAYTPLGFELNADALVGKTAEEIDGMAAEVDKLSQAAALRKPQIEIPEMIDIPGMPGKAIMKGELTVSLFEQVTRGYELTGHNADKLIDLLNDDSKAGEALTYVNLNDAREFAKRLSEQTGRKFRVQTEAEWEASKDKLSGSNWTWTETDYPDMSETKVLRSLGRVSQSHSYPLLRYFNSAVRLVEDL